MKINNNIPRILKINSIEDFIVSCLFDNGESRLIDFKYFFEKHIKLTPNHPAFKLNADLKLFKKIKVIGHTLGWDEVGIFSLDEQGKEVFYNYEIDPVVLFQLSKIDTQKDIEVGLSIKQSRKNAGLTQKELAIKIGTSIGYISRLENNKCEPDILSLKKIMGALGKRLQISIN